VLYGHYALDIDPRFRLNCPSGGAQFRVACGLCAQTDVVETPALSGDPELEIVGARIALFYRRFQAYQVSPLFARLRRRAPQLATLRAQSAVIERG
jgi:hypothetical protein